jgi:hypothetical protein
MDSSIEEEVIEFAEEIHRMKGEKKWQVCYFSLF